MALGPIQAENAQAANAAPVNTGPPDNTALASLLADAMQQITTLRTELAAVQRERSGGRDPDFVHGEGRADRARRRAAKANGNAT